jgi:hypothetical protein
MKDAGVAGQGGSAQDPRKEQRGSCLAKRGSEEAGEGTVTGFQSKGEKGWDGGEQGSDEQVD